jgi:hypothetical protein
MWRESVSGNYVTWRLGNNIRWRHPIDRFAALENWNDSEDINWGWENFKQNIKISAKDSLGLYELKQRKPWFSEWGLWI